MESEIIYNVQAFPYWDWRVALDLFFGGAGVGAFLFAVFMEERFQGRYVRISRTAAWLAPVFIGAGLLLVLLKMGRPFHLYNTYLNFNAASPLWWGSLFQPLLMFGTLIYAWMWRTEAPADDRRQLLGRVLVPVAIIVGAYHGLLLAVNVSVPIWNSGPTVILALLGFASTGIAAVMFVHLLRMKRAGRLGDEAHVAEFLENMIPVRNTLAVVLVLQAVTMFLWYLALNYGSLQDQQALAALNAQYGMLMWGASAGMGVLLPLILGGWVSLRATPMSLPGQVGMITLTSILILAGGVCFRLAIVLGGQVELPMNLF